MIQSRFNFFRGYVIPPDPIPTNPSLGESNTSMCKNDGRCTTSSVKPACRISALEHFGQGSRITTVILVTFLGAPLHGHTPPPNAPSAVLTAQQDQQLGPQSSSSSPGGGTREPRPDVDPASPANTTQPDTRLKQPKRILWVIPNYRAVSADTHLPPLSLHGKYWMAKQDTFDYT